MKVYLVGGAVRDRLLGLPVRERDYVVVGADEARLLALGYRRLDQGFPVFLHPHSGDEYALARRERKTGPGYKGFAVEAGPDVTLEQDLARRDLTINALAEDQQGRIIDLFQGRDDLDAGILRHITPAFSEDPVRLLRIARFAAHLGRWGFRVAHGTQGLLRRMAALDELDTVLPDRFREEQHKALITDQPWRFYQTLQRCGALPRLLPELARAVDQQTGHGGVGQAAPIQALQRAAREAADPALRLAALLAGVLRGPAEAAQLCARLRLERGVSDLLGWAVEWPPERVAEAHGPALLDLLERLKLLHHGARLKAVATLWRALDPALGGAAARRAEQAVALAGSVDGALLRNQGWAGAALGAELRRRRVEAIAQGLSQGSADPGIADAPRDSGAGRA